MFSDLELNDYLLEQETPVIIGQDAVLNTTILANQLDNTFVLFINNLEDDMSSWNDLLICLKDSNEEKANIWWGIWFCDKILVLKKRIICGKINPII